MGFQTQPIIDFIGKGPIFPIELDSKGKGVVETGFPLIESSMQMILNWCSGQNLRFFLGEYNSRLTRLLEEPNDDVLLDLIETLIKDSLETWEPRIKLVSVRAVRLNESTVTTSVVYQILNTATTRSFVFPFYTTITN